MHRIILAFSTFLFLTGHALAQVESDYCKGLKADIQRIQKSLNGITALVNGTQLAFLKCTPDPGETFEFIRRKCTHMQGSHGTWHDPETRTLYVIFTKAYVRDFAQGKGAAPAALTKSLSDSEDLKNKIRGSDVIPNLQGELRKWIKSYDNECRPTARRPARPPSGGGLLNVPGALGR